MKSERLPWLDAAKGGAVVLVVFHHALLHADDLDLAPRVYETLNYYLRQMRMPMFFLASGLASSFLLARAPGDYIARRIVPTAWIFVVWSALTALAFGRIGTLVPFAEGGLGPFLAQNVLTPIYHMWFVWALLVLGLAVMALSRLPRPVAIGLSLVPAVLVSAGAVPLEAAPVSTRALELTLLYAPLFTVGAVAGAPLIAAAGSPRATGAVLLGAAAVFVTANVAGKALWPAAFEPLALVRTAAGALVGLMGAVAMTRVARLRPLLVWLGERSLAIFLAHELVLRPLYAGLARVEAASPAMQAAAVPATTALAVTASVALWAVAGRVGLGWLYVLPSGRWYARWRGLPGAPVQRTSPTMS